MSSPVETLFHSPATSRNTGNHIRGKKVKSSSTAVSAYIPENAVPKGTGPSKAPDYLCQMHVVTEGYSTLTLDINTSNTSKSIPMCL